MKRLLFIVAVAMVSLTAQAQFTKATLKASGLTCALCGNAVNKSLEKLSFIDKVRTDIKNMSFSLSFKADAEVNIDAIKAAVEDAGFSVAALQLTGNFTNQKVENDKHVQIGSDYFHFLKIENQVLSGEHTVTILDKNFLSAGEFKNIKNATKMACIDTGKAAACCTKDGIEQGQRIYHVTI